MLEEMLTLLVALLAGATASLAGFGIGSLLTPLLAPEMGTKLAVAVVAIPHFLGTALRFWMMRRHLDRRLLRNFGIASALFGLLGALLHAYATTHLLSLIFGALLVFSGISTFTGWIKRLHPGKRTAWVAGGLSGIFGGMVGNQGGIRTAALLGFHVSRDAFIATATAVALMVDVGRLPIYLFTSFSELRQQISDILLGSLGVVMGTLLGARLLRYVPEQIFRRMVAVLIIALGIWMFYAGPG